MGAKTGQGSMRSQSLTGCLHGIHLSRERERERRDICFYNKIKNKKLITYWETPKP